MQNPFGMMDMGGIRTTHPSPTSPPPNKQIMYVKHNVKSTYFRKSGMFLEMNCSSLKKLRNVAEWLKSFGNPKKSKLSRIA
jgi:hypothetical protein